MAWETLDDEGYLILYDDVQSCNNLILPVITGSYTGPSYYSTWYDTYAPNLIYKFTVVLHNSYCSDALYNYFSKVIFDRPWSAWYQIIDSENDYIHFIVESEEDAVRIKLMYDFTIQG